MYVSIYFQGATLVRGLSVMNTQVVSACCLLVPAADVGFVLVLPLEKKTKCYNGLTGAPVW